MRVLSRVYKYAPDLYRHAPSIKPRPHSTIRPHQVVVAPASLVPPVGGGGEGVAHEAAEEGGLAHPELPAQDHLLLRDLDTGHG